MNQVFLIGHVGQEVRKTQTNGGKTVLNFSMATNEYWMEGQEKKQKTEWHQIVVWGKLSEALTLTKGQKIFVTGKISAREYQAKDGTTKKSFDIVASSIIPAALVTTTPNATPSDNAGQEPNW